MNVVRSRLLRSANTVAPACRRLRCVAPNQSFASSSSTGDEGRNNVDNQVKENPNEGPEEDASKPHFPWRHSPDPLPRVVERDDLSGLPNNWRGRFIRKALAARELGISWFQIFFANSWEDRLAKEFAWAFQQGVAGLLSSTFRVHLDEIDGDVSGISVDTVRARARRVWEDEDKEAADDFLKSVLEENLRNLYKEVVPSALQLKLTLTPVDSRLEGLFIIPMITRDIVRKDPSLKGGYQRIEQVYNETGSAAKVKEMADELAKKTGFTGKRSIIADVSVDCLETFQVRDDRTGEVVQGSANSKDEPVTHLVRFEMSTSKGFAAAERELGSWQIIDWDDLLEGNVWH